MRSLRAALVGVVAVLLSGCGYNKTGQGRYIKSILAVSASSNNIHCIINAYIYFHRK